MKKILVTSIEFKTTDSGKRSIEFELSNNVKCTLIPDSKGVTSLSASTITRTIRDIGYLIMRACASFLIGDEKETMSMNEVTNADRLARERFDWASAGYDVREGDEDEMNERCSEMCWHIAHFENI